MANLVSNERIKGMGTGKMPTQLHATTVAMGESPPIAGKPGIGLRGFAKTDAFGIAKTTDGERLALWIGFVVLMLTKNHNPGAVIGDERTARRTAPAITLRFIGGLFHFPFLE
jgi:hypothetical protein